MRVRPRRSTRRRARAARGTAISIACVAVTGALWLGLSRTIVRARVHLRGDDPEIEVLLTALDGAPRVSVGAGASAEWIVTDVSNRILERGPGTRAASFETSASGHLLLGGRDLDVGEAIVTTADRTPLAAGSGTYRGSIRVASRKGALRATNRVPLESYLASVVGSEMYARSTKPAALEAQAIAARTYARWEIEERGRLPLPDSQEAQAYYGVARETPSTRAAVAATRGLELRFDGDVLPAFYHSTCGGRTIDGTFLLGSRAPAPLAGATCGFCNEKNAKFFKWRVTLGGDVLDKVAADLGVGDHLRWLEPVGPDGAPWSQVRIAGDAKTSIVGQRELRAAVNRATKPTTFPSAFLDGIEGARTGIAVQGHGFGHGVGLCQVGAAEMAKQGSSHDEILRRYYPGATVERATAASDGAPR